MTVTRSHSSRDGSSTDNRSYDELTDDELTDDELTDDELTDDEYPRVKARARRTTRSPKIALAQAAWLLSMRWEKAVEKAVAPLGLTFTQWLVLSTAHELIRKTRDAVSQRDVANEIALNKMTMSHVVRSLEKRDLISRGPSFGGRPSDRIFLSSRGERVLAKARSRAEAATTF